MGSLLTDSDNSEIIRKPTAKELIGRCLAEGALYAHIDLKDADAADHLPHTIQLHCGECEKV
jgi:hypothetical protein